MMEAPYHYQFRIIVIGDTMVGKSSLLKTFSEGAFGEMEPTVGVDFFSKLIEIKPKRREPVHNHSQNRKTRHSRLMSNDHVDETLIVKLQIWDTAGQERFKSIVTSYYRNSVGIVLVYDVTNRESYDHLINWFNEACRHVEPSSSPEPMSPLTHNPPKLINMNSQHPLTSTPNATPIKNDRKKMATRTNGNNSITNHNKREFDDDGVDSLSSFASNTNCDNSSMSFNSLTSELNNQQQFEASRYKMAYLVIGCKTDLESQRQVSYEDGLAFANAYGFKFIETSSKMYYNVDRAFQLLAEEIHEKIRESGRLNQLHRTPSGSHLMFVDTTTTGASSTHQVNEGIRIGPLIESSLRNRYHDRDRVRLLEAQPVSGFLGGCC